MLGTEDMVMNKTNMVPPFKDAYTNISTVDPWVLRVPTPPP